MKEELDTLQRWEMWSYVATVIAALSIPAGIVTYMIDRGKERVEEQEQSRIEREENYSRLQAEFRKAQFWLADHPEVNKHELPPEDATTRGQQEIYYSTLISLFEESFILFYKPEDPEYQRMWNTWADYIQEWLQRPNFRKTAPELLAGEDKEFVVYMQHLLEAPITNTPSMDSPA